MFQVIVGFHSTGSICDIRAIFYSNMSDKSCTLSVRVSVVPSVRVSAVSMDTMTIHSMKFKYCSCCCLYNSTKGDYSPASQIWLHIIFFVVTRCFTKADNQNYWHQSEYHHRLLQFSERYLFLKVVKRPTIQVELCKLMSHCKNVSQKLGFAMILIIDSILFAVFIHRTIEEDNGCDISTHPATGYM